MYKIRIPINTPFRKAYSLRMIASLDSPKSPYCWLITISLGISQTFSEALEAININQHINCHPIWLAKSSDALPCGPAGPSRIYVVDNAKLVMLQSIFFL